MGGHAEHRVAAGPGDAWSGAGAGAVPVRGGRHRHRHLTRYPQWAGDTCVRLRRKRKASRATADPFTKVLDQRWNGALWWRGVVCHVAVVWRVM